MIEIIIKRRTVEKFKVKKNLVTKKTPTNLKDRYEATIFQEEYAVVESDEQKEVESTMLHQQITEESDFSLGAVICAINNLPRERK